MLSALDRIQAETRLLKLDDAFLFLNHLLAVARGERQDPALDEHLRSRKARAPAFVVHFLAKQLLLLGSNLGIHPLDGPRFIRLQDLYFQLDDPIVHDPAWKDADPTGFFERLLGQQLPSQRRNMLQKYGLALGLFRDAGPVHYPVPYDLKGEIEGELGLPVEQFMAMGHLAYALRRASINGHECNGTFDHLYLVEAFRQGIAFCVPEVWRTFLARATRDRDGFRAACHNDLYRVKDALYTQFEFNPLHRFPLIDVGGGRFVAVDPDLIVERATFGLFYDLFERDGIVFAERFGYVFDQLVGKLLGSACPQERLWSAAAWEAALGGKKPKNASKIGDWVYKGESRNVLVECKSLRPSLELLTYGLDDSVKATVGRIASALEQLIRHDRAIQQGQWQAQGLAPKPAACVVVTYGRIQTINGPFVRRRVLQHLADKGLEALPFVVLSLEELDMAIRLVELGHPFDGVISSLSSNEDSFEPMAQFAAQLQTHALSSFSYDKGKAFMDGIAPDQGCPLG
jgi:hypothetical protein